MLNCVVSHGHIYKMLFHENGLEFVKREFLNNCA